jgi:hypothetical protein
VKNELNNLVGVDEELSMAAVTPAAPPPADAVLPAWESETPEWARKLLVGWFYAVIVFQIVVAFWQWGRTWDDSAITLGFARTLALTGRIEPTPGSGIVEGYSTTLWMLIMALVAKLNANPVFIYRAAKILTLALNILNMVLVRRLVSRSGAWVSGLIVAAVFGMQLATMYETLNGMEGPVSLTLILLLGLWFDDRGAAMWKTGVAGSLFILTRWEAAWLLVPVLLLRRRDRAWYVVALVWATVFIGSNLWRWHYFGSLIPNTITAKMGPPYVWKTLGAQYRRRILVVKELVNLFWPYVAFGWVCGKLALPRLRDMAAGMARSRTLQFAAAVAGFAFFESIAIGRNWGHANRAVFPVLALVVYLVVMAGGLLAKRGPALARRLSIPGLVAIAVVMLVMDVQALLGTPRSRVDEVAQLAPALERIRVAAHLDTLKFAGPDVGGLMLMSDHVTVIDVGLLCNARLAKERYEVFRQYVFLEEKPDVIEVHDIWAVLTRVRDTPEFFNDYGVMFVNGMRLFVRRDRSAAISSSLLEAGTFGETGASTAYAANSWLAVNHDPVNFAINKSFGKYLVLR